MISQFTLENGIRVVSEHLPHAHSVSIGIWVASGSRNEPSSLSGMAHFIEHMLFKGTPRRTALDIAREIDSVGGVLNAFTSREYVCYYAKVLHKHLPRAVDLLADIFLNSQFDQQEMEKERKVILQEIRMLEDTPDDLVHDLFYRSFWGGGALGRSILGTEETVSAITRDAATAYREQVYRGENIIIAVAGRAEADEVERLVRPLFASVPSGGKETSEPASPRERSVTLHERDLEQVHLCLGTRALRQGDPARYAVFLMNSVLGGGMSSRLFQEVREKQGLAYSVYSYLSSYSDSGALVVYAGTSLEKTDEVLEIVMKELRRLKTEPLSAVELESSREQYKGNLLLSLESSDNRMTKLAKNIIYFGRHVPILEIVQGFDGVTAEALLEVASGMLSEENLHAVLVGNVGGRDFSGALS